MFPVLRVGDDIWSVAAWEEVEHGMIVRFWYWNFSKTEMRIKIHRVTGGNHEDGFNTDGIKTNKMDRGRVTKSRYISSVVDIYRNGVSVGQERLDKFNNRFR